MKTTFKIAITAALTFALVSCSQDNFEPETGVTKGTKIESTITIAQLRTQYMTSTEFFTADRITSSNQLVINGIVTSTDIEGNVYKYIAVKEETPNGRSLRVSVDASGISSIYPIGQRVSVILNDLCIGKYGDSPQLGIYYSRPKDGRISPGAIPMPIARQKIIPYGEPDPQAVVPDTMTIAQILSAPRDNMHYRLVCIKNAWFTGKGFDFGQPATIADKDKIFAPGTGGIGYPQSREIQDGTGSTVIATSEFAKFAQHRLPAATYKGNITVIVSWYRDKSSSAGNYQLTLRTLGDLGTGFDGYLSAVKYTRQ
ncbi:MAG TPA: DUF5689 domain-containing protein [Paludibacter sp.]|nr:DUF5689 domain-containing protein [Paludibacter sp.]